MSVKDYFNNKNIFITGGSGFIGKCLIEKLLRSIPEIGNIYILLRSKKGQKPQERLKHIFNDELFDKLKQTYPDFIRKIVVIEGNVQEPKLGINEEDKKVIIENVDIIYHTAASVRFDDPLHYAILINVRSTRDLAELALEVKHLKAFVHVSTAYGNCDKKIVEEKLYPCPGNWKEAIRLAEEGDRTITDYLTGKYIHPLANTYVFAKALAEHVVKDICCGKIPAIIVRPSIVIGAAVEPSAGWTDNLNGPTGLFYAGGTGLMRTLYCDGKTVLDIVPVDVVANAMILTAYQLMKEPSENKIEVYNNSIYKDTNVTMQKAIDYGFEAHKETPGIPMYWYPYTKATKYKFVYYFKAILLHIIPALIVDSLLRIFGRKPILYKVQKKIFIANVVVSHFTLNTWYFKNHKTMNIEKGLTEEDLELFGIKKIFDYIMRNTKDYFKNQILGVQRNCFKQNVDLKKNKKLFWRLWIADLILRILFYVFLLWLIKTTNILGIIYQRFENYIVAL